VRPSRAVAALVTVFLVLAPRVAHACPVCFDPRDENRVAFLTTTVFLSLLPLALVAGVGLWLHRRARAAEAADA